MRTSVYCSWCVMAGERGSAMCFKMGVQVTPWVQRSASASLLRAAVDGGGILSS